MRKTLIGLFVGLTICLSCFGCAKSGQMEYIQVVHDHKLLTNETMDAVIASIQDDIKNMKDAGVLTPDMEVSAQQLIDRLIMIKLQSTAISNWVDATIVDEKILAQLVRAKWNKE